MGGGASKQHVGVQKNIDLEDRIRATPQAGGAVTVIQPGAAAAGSPRDVRPGGLPAAEGAAGMAADPAKVTTVDPLTVQGSSQEFDLRGDGAPIPLSGASGPKAHVDYANVEDICGKEGQHSKYIKLSAIGKGAFGEAHVVQRNGGYNPADHECTEKQFRSNPLAQATMVGERYVAKILDMRAMLSQDRQYAQTEIMCLAHTKHFAIIKYFEHYILDSDDETMVIVTEFADHGDLKRNLTRVDSNGASSRWSLSEREAGTLFVQLLLALHHIHSRRMMHRDIKSANVFLTSQGFLKLGDFGFSKKYESTVSSETIASTFLGTPYYLSPEMWGLRRYGKKADIWAAGTVLYEMLTGGERPFEGSSLPELRNAVLEKEFVPPSHVAADLSRAANADGTTAQAPLSSEMRELLELMFRKDPTQRPSTEELLHTPVMRHYLSVLERHVQSLVDADNAAKAANPAVDPFTLHFHSDDDRALALQGVADAKALVATEVRAENADGASAHYEGVIYKDSHNGVWKERYLILHGGDLMISLSPGKEALKGAERSRKVPLSSIAHVSVCEVDDAHVRLASNATQAPSEGYTPPYAFAICMRSSNTIAFGVATMQERDEWLKRLMDALAID